ncbi:MAG TPA: hypothetical protein VKA09_10270 [Nitrososphaeraceae archaeon]|nr:hypothetical protein [Nitrososphaeraceae archaeon]
MATETTTRTTATLILATFALVTIGVLPVASAQDGDLERSVDPETGNVQVAESKPDLSEDNDQRNILQLLEDMGITQSLGGASGGGGGTGSSAASDSDQSQSADDASLGNINHFGDDLGIATAFNVGQVNVDLRDLVDLNPSQPAAE